MERCGEIRAGTSSDRLVLVAGAASGNVCLLAEALERCKTDEPGAFTAGEQDALTRLDEMVSELTVKQRELVRKCAVITVLDVEEEQSVGAAHARLLLGRVVGGGEVAVRAWRDLVKHCGRVGRLRGGFGIEGWVRLLQEDGYQVTGYATPAAGAARCGNSAVVNAAAHSGTADWVAGRWENRGLRGGSGSAGRCGGCTAADVGFAARR